VTRVLVIDDDASVLDMIAMALQDEGYVVVTAVDGFDGLAAHADEAFDAIVSDVNMPRVDGFTLCRRLRDAGDATPLLLLSARDSEIDEALGLDLGADDYLCKPFRSRVLAARLRAVLRRGTVTTNQANVVVQGELVLDHDRLEIRYRDTPIQTTVTEFRLFAALVERPGVVQSREQLLIVARRDDSVVAPRLVDTYVRKLRKKLTSIEADFDRIETVIGAGYRWRDPS
jgi:DNA-binding response OmpR family regulator